MNKSTRRANWWLWLTIPIAILLAVAAGGGLFIKGLYRDTPNLVTQAIGQDAITLVVALPTLVISAFLTSRGSQRARLVWLGGLIYMVYTYVGYAFAVRFNSLFLVYVALLGWFDLCFDWRPRGDGLGWHQGGLHGTNACQSGKYLSGSDSSSFLFSVVK